MNLYLFNLYLFDHIYIYRYISRKLYVVFAFIYILSWLVHCHERYIFTYISLLYYIFAMRDIYLHIIGLDWSAHCNITVFISYICQFHGVGPCLCQDCGTVCISITVFISYVSFMELVLAFALSLAVTSPSHLLQSD